jgi:hypothetical protein
MVPVSFSASASSSSSLASASPAAAFSSGWMMSSSLARSRPISCALAGLFQIAPDSSSAFTSARRSFFSA